MSLERQALGLRGPLGPFELQPEVLFQPSDARLIEATEALSSLADHLVRRGCAGVAGGLTRARRVLRGLNPKMSVDEDLEHGGAERGGLPKAPEEVHLAALR